MVKKIPFAIYSLTCLIALIVSAVLTTPALADSGTTNPTPPTAGSGSTRGSHTSSNNLSNVPSGTKVVIIDSNGDKVPLGSQEAADILNSGDPIWCPATLAAPAPGGTSGCISDTSLSNLFGDFSALIPAANGTIWIDQTTESLAASLSGTGKSMANFTLTLKGGWVGGCVTLPCSGSITGTTTFTGGISITNWNNNITLSNIIVSNPAGNGLTISTTKNITLTNVQASHNGGSYGASLDNSGGTGTVTITSSEFDDNNVGIYGLSVKSNGAVTLTNSFAMGNTAGYGVYLDTTQAVMVTGNGAYSSAESAFDNSFNNNHYNGLYITTNGAVTLTDITASDNGKSGSLGYGASVNNTGGTSAVTLTGMNIFSGNYGDGLDVTSKGAITASHIDANSNSHGNGAVLDNSTASAAQAMTITGTSQFNGNGDGGLIVNSRGAITLNNITASFNQNGDGAYLDNNYNPAVASGVTLTGTNFFNNNSSALVSPNTGGLVIYSDGAIKLNSITANGNTGTNLHNNGWGVWMNNQGASKPQAVTLTGINTFDNNYGEGIQVYGGGIVNAASITANSNEMDGAYFAGSSVTLTTASLNGNGIDSIDQWSNLDIVAGAVTASNLSITGDQHTDGADISGTTVTLSGNNLFDSNYNNGLSITATGAVTLNNITATNNGILGMNGDGVTVTTSGAVNITGTNIFNGNYSGGLYVTTSGAISANALTANNNTQGYGVLFSNSATSLPGVTLTGANFFNNNNSYGLEVDTYGTITASNLNAIGNVTGDGVDLYNFFNPALHPTPKAVTISGSNTFGDNGVNGLVVVSLGAITVNNVTAYVSPTGTSTGKSVALSNAVTNAVGGVT
ncbi:MAG: hypothetical protein WBW94_16590, partial [Anaerolineales bacterium]